MIDRLQDAVLRIVSRLGLFDMEALCFWRDAEEQAREATERTRKRHNQVEAAYLRRRKGEADA